MKCHEKLCISLWISKIRKNSLSKFWKAKFHKFISRFFDQAKIPHCVPKTFQIKYRSRCSPWIFFSCGRCHISVYRVGSRFECMRWYDTRYNTRYNSEWDRKIMGLSLARGRMGINASMYVDGRFVMCERDALIFILSNFLKSSKVNASVF